MEGYFVNIWNKDTLKHIDIVDYAEREPAIQLAKEKAEDGYGVSVWKGIRIYTTG